MSDSKITTPSSLPIGNDCLAYHIDSQSSNISGQLANRHRTDLFNTHPQHEGVIATVFLVSVPRRGESIEFTEPTSGSKRLFRIADVVHTEVGLRMHGQITKSLHAV